MPTPTAPPDGASRSTTSAKYAAGRGKDLRYTATCGKPPCSTPRRSQSGCATPSSNRPTSHATEATIRRHRHLHDTGRRPRVPSAQAPSCGRRRDRPPYTDAQLRGSTPGSAQQTRARSRLKGKAGHRRARTILGLGRKPGQSIEFPGQRADGGGVPKSVGCGFVRANDPARYKDDAGRTPRATGR